MLQLLGSITDPCLVADSEGRTTFANEPAAAYFHASRPALRGRPVWEHFASQDGRTVEETCRAAVSDGAIHRCRVCSSSAASIPGRDVEVIAALVATCLVIVVRERQGDLALRRRLREFEALLDVVPVGIGIALDPEARHIQTNRALARMLRMDQQGNASLTAPEAQRPRHFRVRHRGREVPGTGLPLQVAAREGREVSDFETDVVFDDGEVLHLLEYAAPLFDEQGQPRGSIGAFVDVSERVAAEERFRQMADSAPVFIWLADADGKCTWLNRPWLEFTGRTLEQDLGHGWSESIHPDDHDASIQAFRDGVATQKPFAIGYRLRRHDGEWRWVYDVGRPLFGGPGGAFSGFIGSCIDVTENKLAEERREELLDAERTARTAAERANRLKDEFLASLSHELRTPLNSILGWTQLLRVRGSSPELLSQGLDTLERSAKLQAQLIDDLLDMSRILSGKVRLDVQHVEPARVVEAAVEVVRPSAEARSVRLQTLLNPNAGPVSGDPTRLQQIVWNLLSNAVKFTPSGGRVQVLLERGNSHVEITVTDSGVGIAPEFLPHVFDRFRQADASTTRQHGGLGIGLSIAKQLAELHGGTIRAKSPGVNQGATFIVTLPILLARHGDGERRHPRAGAGPWPDAPRPSLTGVCVLVLDGDPDARQLISLFLTEGGAEVETASSAEEAIATLQRRPPDVIVSDIGPPDEDGHGFIRRVRSLGDDFRRVPALALTAFAHSEDRRRALVAGFQLHLSKPVEPIELCTAVASLAERLP